MTISSFLPIRTIISELWVSLLCPRIEKRPVGNTRMKSFISSANCGNPNAASALRPRRRTQTLDAFQVQSMPPPAPNHQPGNVYIGGHEKDASTTAGHGFEAAAFQMYDAGGSAPNKEIPLLTSYTEEGSGDAHKPSVVGVWVVV